VVGILLFYILKQYYINESCTFFQGLLSGILSVPKTEWR